MQKSGLRGAPPRMSLDGSLKITMEKSVFTWHHGGILVFQNNKMAAILVSQNKETAAMLVSQTNPAGVELFSYVNDLFCSNKFA